MQQGRPNMRTRTFVVPAGAGDYAPEVLYLGPENDPKGGLDAVDEIQGLIRSLPATAVLEIDLKKPGGGDPSLDASWNLNVSAFAAAAAGPFGLLKLAGWQGVRFRAKSGGTGGNLVLDLSWIAKS